MHFHQMNGEKMHEFTSKHKHFIVHSLSEFMTVHTLASEEKIGKLMQGRMQGWGRGGQARLP